jgi:hypothetical protein
LLSPGPLLDGKPEDFFSPLGARIDVTDEDSQQSGL